MAAAVAAAVILAYFLPSASASGRSIVRMQTGPATLVLSHNGKTLKVDHFTCGPNFTCNVVEFDWRAGKCPSGATTENPPVVAVLTTDGQYYGEPAVAPCVTTKTAAAGKAQARRDVAAGVNDVEYVPSSPSESGQTITTAWWTRDGTMVSRILPPQISSQGAVHATSTTESPNELHVYWNYAPKERLTAIKLKNGGKVVAILKVPTGTNQIDWFGYTPQVIP